MAAICLGLNVLSGWWICNTDYIGLKWSNINTFWKIYSKYNSVDDACNNNPMMNYLTIEGGDDLTIEGGGIEIEQRRR